MDVVENPLEVPTRLQILPEYVYGSTASDSNYHS
jgi:hypothetical protein